MSNVCKCVQQCHTFLTIPETSSNSMTMDSNTFSNKGCEKSHSLVSLLSSITNSNFMTASSQSCSLYPDQWLRYVQDVSILNFSRTKAQDFQKFQGKNCNNIVWTTHMKIRLVPALAWYFLESALVFVKCRCRWTMSWSCSLHLLPSWGWRRESAGVAWFVQCSSQYIAANHCRALALRQTLVYSGRFHFSKWVFKGHFWPVQALFQFQP